MSSEIFVDTSAWYPLADRSHPGHARLAERLRTRIAEAKTVVTTNLVLAESHALILRHLGRRPALTFLERARAAPNVVEFSTAEVEARAERDWLAPSDDQDFSLTDAVSFVIMTDRGIEEALALDRHFATAGFVVEG